MTSKRLFNSFIPTPPPPKKLSYPPKQISGYAPAVTITRSAAATPVQMLLVTITVSQIAAVKFNVLLDT